MRRRNHRRKRPRAWWRRGTYWKPSPPSTITLGSWTIYLHPCTPASSFSESIAKYCLLSNILLSLQPCRKEHHCLYYHPEHPVPILWVSQRLGLGNGKVLDEILKFTLEKRYILAGTRKLSCEAITIIPQQQKTLRLWPKLWWFMSNFYDVLPWSPRLSHAGAQLYHSQGTLIYFAAISETSRKFLLHAGIWRTRVLQMISEHWTAPKQLHSHGWVKVSWPFFFSEMTKIKKHSHQTHNWKQCLSKKNASFNITPYFGRKYIQSKNFLDSSGCKLVQ